MRIKETQLVSLIRKTIKDIHLNEEKECGCPGGVGCCYNQNHCEDDEICSGLCCKKKKSGKVRRNYPKDYEITPQAKSTHVPSIPDFGPGGVPTKPVNPNTGSGGKLTKTMWRCVAGKCTQDHGTIGGEFHTREACEKWCNRKDGPNPKDRKERPRISRFEKGLSRYTLSEGPICGDKSGEACGNCGDGFTWQDLTITNSCVCRNDGGAHCHSTGSYLGGGDVKDVKDGLQNKGRGDKSTDSLRLKESDVKRIINKIIGEDVAAINPNFKVLRGNLKIEGSTYKLQTEKAYMRIGIDIIKASLDNRGNAVLTIEHPLSGKEITSRIRKVNFDKVVNGAKRGRNEITVENEEGKEFYLVKV